MSLDVWTSMAAFEEINFIHSRTGNAISDFVITKIVSVLSKILDWIGIDTEIDKNK